MPTPGESGRLILPVQGTRQSGSLATMFEQGVRIARRCATALLGCIVSLCFGGCGETDEAIFIVLDLDQVSVPSEVDSICLGIWDVSATGGQFGRRYTLESVSDATLAVAPGSAEEGRVLLHGLSFGRRVALHQQSFDWSEDEVEVPLVFCAPGRRDGATSRGEVPVAAGSTMAVSQGPEGAWIVVAAPGETQIVAAGTGGLEILAMAAPVVIGGAQQLVSFDVDGDCDDDLLVLGADGLSIWRRDRGALVSADELLPSQGTVASMKAAVVLDYNNDLYSDVALIGESGLVLWEGAQDGLVSMASGILPGELSGASAIAAADLDGDGAVDLAIAREGGSDLLLYGDGSGTFDVDAQALPQDDLDSRGIGIADIDGDGVAEIVVAAFGAPVAAFARDDARRYEDRSFLLLPNADVLDATGLSVGDWNGDCEEDLLFAGTASQSWASDRGGLIGEDALGGASEVLLEDLIGTGERDALLLSDSTLVWWRR